MVTDDGGYNAGSGGGVIQGTASEAVLVALLAARDHTLKRDESVSVDRLVVYGSDQTHSALKKASQVLLLFAFLNAF